MPIGSAAKSFLDDFNFLFYYSNEILNLRNEIVNNILNCQEQLRGTDDQANLIYGKGFIDGMNSVLFRIDDIYEKTAPRDSETVIPNLLSSSQHDGN